MTHHCQRCAQLVGAHNLYLCGRCKKHACPRCLDRQVVAYCRECAVLARGAGDHQEPQEGQEMKHTPEPWRRGKHATEVVADLQPEDAGATGHADVDYYGGYLIAESIRKVADRERIIACVNACKGLPSRELQRNVVRDVIDALVSVRKELLPCYDDIGYVLLDAESSQALMRQVQDVLARLGECSHA